MHNESSYIAIVNITVAYW